MGYSEKINRSMRSSIWLLYVLIVFEILYMISPFAFYYYSGYAIPLNWLQASPLTSWLTVYVFPHFSYNTSLVVTGLLTISWPLVGLGLLIFTVGFFQIYWAKFTRKQVVSRGMYRIIRHPQYVGLAILGLGTTIYWSRFIVVLAYFSMLFLYYFLAKQEERICLEKYGRSYQDYLDSTGMFFPKVIEDRFPGLPAVLSTSGLKSFLVKLLLYFGYIGVIMAIGLGLKDFALSRIATVSIGQGVVVATAPLEKDRIMKITSLFFQSEQIKNELQRSPSKKQLVYIVPSDWVVPELDIWGRDGQHFPSNSSTHGNSLEFNPYRYTVLLTEPVTYDENATGDKILKTGIAFIPIFSAVVDLENSRISQFKRISNRGKWDGIPVPIY